MNTQSMYVFKLYIRNKIREWIPFGISFLIFIFVFYLYSFPIGAIQYGCLLSVCIFLLWYMYDFYQYYKQYQFLLYMKQNIIDSFEAFPTTNDMLQREYQEMIRILYTNRLDLQTNYTKKQKEQEDYYTIWAHQIKTPISAMRLLLQSNPTNDNHLLKAELFKIEQYVEMVLQYERLYSTSTDFVFASYRVSDIVKQAIRKYSVLFIQKKIKLEFVETAHKIVTDEKWFLFILEQLLSNALKYTQEGGQIQICFSADNPNELCIIDHGIGIAPEDLPRVFERGFTGYNGRMEKKSTGVGLYLCAQVAKNLGHTLSITSVVGQGTTVSIEWICQENKYE